MSEEKKCLRCGSASLENGELQSTGKVYAHPKNANLTAVLKTGVPVDVVMCYDCGHVELVVDAERVKSLVGTS